MSSSDESGSDGSECDESAGGEVDAHMHDPESVWHIFPTLVPLELLRDYRLRQEELERIEQEKEKVRREKLLAEQKAKEKIRMKEEAER